MNNIQSCCKGCTKRELGCHSTCEDYANYRAKVDEYNEIVRKKHIEEVSYTGYKYSRINSTRRS